MDLREVHILLDLVQVMDAEVRQAAIQRVQEIMEVHQADMDTRQVQARTMEVHQVDTRWDQIHLELYRVYDMIMLC